MLYLIIYDDRLEVTSPGGLYNGLTYEEVMSGHSKIRNKLIANVFSQMGLVESWGSGIRRILSKAEEYGLKEPKIEAFDDMFRVNLYRNIGEVIGESIGDELEFDVSRLNETQIKVLKSLKEDKYLSATKLAEITGIARRNVENNIKKLKDMGILVRQGSPKSGCWVIVKKGTEAGGRSHS